jgi:hypothetical protein
MPTAHATGDSARPQASTPPRRLAANAWLIAALLVIGLMLVWAVHDGGYDEDTWYWGALIMLALLTAILIARGLRAIRISRAGKVALGAFALYVAWSYLSITWAESPGDALTGSNRALLYLLVFATMLVLPWTVRGALTALLAFALGVGVVAIVLLFRLASADNVGELIIGGRLAAPTGYFNSTAALFTIQALVAIALTARRELPGPVRGALVAFACAGLQLAVVVQSRGWLFTLPLVVIVAIVIVPDRLRVAGAAVLPVVGALVPVHRLLAFYQHSSGPALERAASNAGHAALVVCALVFFVATLVAWADSLARIPTPTVRSRHVLGASAIVLAVVGVGAGGLAATHGHPVRFVERQWNGFSHPQATTTGSHFTDVGSSRYDFWRVSLDAFLAHPIGGLGQDNFDDYYMPRRRTTEEPSYTHSLELRLLIHTGLVGFALFAVFIVAAIAAAMPARRRRGLEASVVAVALLPLVVWLIHGSIDWFWEFPALSGPALGFLAMAGALGAVASRADSPAEGSELAPPRAGVRALTAVAGALALLLAVVVLGFPYLSVREVSVASDIRGSNPAKALNDLRIAADLNPLSPDPGRIGGTIGLQTGQYATARQRFEQTVSRDPGGWYGWLGAGLAASALGERALARHDFQVARSINPKDPVINEALDRVASSDPLTPGAALQSLVFRQ